MKRWEVLASEYVVRHSFYTLRADRCRTAQGVVVDPYYVEEASDWVHVFALDSEERVLLVEQYRHAAGLVCLELPGGVVDAGESALAAAARELLEETGCRAAEYLELPVVCSNPARCTNRILPFLALGAVAVADQRLDSTEDIRTHWVPLAELMEIIASGRFPQALHVSTVFLALQSLGRGPFDIEPPVG